MVSFDTFFNQLESLKELEDPFAKADEIAEAVVKYFGPVIVLSDCYYAKRVFLTIMDGLQESIFGLDPVVEWLMLRAFKKTKCKFARDCTYAELRGAHAQNSYPAYGFNTWRMPNVPFSDMHHDTIGYDFESIKRDKTQLHRELMKTIMDRRCRLLRQWRVDSRISKSPM